MGAWGNKPYMNDEGVDWFGTTLQPVADSIQQLLDAPVNIRLYNKYRAAGWLLAKICRPHIYPADLIEPHLFTIHERLQTVRDDVVWMDRWVDNQMRNEMNDLICQIQRICRWNNIDIKF